MIHRLAHWLGLHRGFVVTWFEGPRLLVGFRCATCGELSHVHERDSELP